MPSPTYTDEGWTVLGEQLRLLASIILEREVATWEALETVNKELNIKLVEKLSA